MAVNILSPKKCCCCIPLRKGLLCMGYLRLVICVFTIFMLTMMCVTMFERMPESYESALIFLKLVASIIPLLLDLIFTVTLIVAAHKKSVKLFELYYLYCATMVLIYLSILILMFFDSIRFSIFYYIMFQYAWIIDCGTLEFIVLGVVVILLHTYMTILVRSKVQHLKEKKHAELARQRSSMSIRLPQLHRMK